MIKVAFVCVHNSNRSQIAEGFARKYGKGIIDVYSAGTTKYHEIKPLTILVMKEINIDITNQYPKLLDDIPNPDILITMGCKASCPWVLNQHKEDWNINDSTLNSIDDYRKARDKIKDKVLDLIERIKSNKLSE